MSSKPRAWCCLLLLVACAEPSYVSLGRNAQSVASAADAGSDDGSVDEAATLGCEAAAAGGLPDDPATPGSDMSFGCGLEPPPPPAEPDCQLQGESVRVDSPCEQRALVTCPDSINAIDRTSGMLFDMLARCTELEYHLTVTFEAGCATAFSLEARETLVTPGIRDCIGARLAAERYDCARAAECSSASTFPILTR